MTAAVETIDPTTDPATDPVNEFVAGEVTAAETETAVPGGEKPGEDEWYSIVWVPPGSLIIGPNTRQENAIPDKDRVRSIKKRGVRQPIKAYRDEAGDLVVTTGQIRTLAAVEAGVEKVPVWVQPPPVDDGKAAEIDRIIEQLDENDHRTAMTRNDVYQAHKQLELLGLSATAIARRRSRSKKVIEDSLRVGDSELASKAGDKYDLTMEQLAVIAEFEGYGDLEAAKKLILTAVERPNNFNVLAQRLRNDRAEAERLRQSEAALVEQLTAAGVTIFDESISDWSGDARSLDRLRPSPDDEQGTELTVEAHAICPGHGAWIAHEHDENDDLVAVAKYGCSDFRAHGHAQAYAPAGRAEYGTGTTATLDTSSTTPGDTDDVASAAARAALEQENARLERRWVRENNKDWDAAVEVRHRFLANFARRTSAHKTGRRWLAMQKLTGAHELRKAMEHRHALARRLLNLPEHRFGQDDELVDKIANASEARATVLDMFLTLAAMEEGLQRDSWRRPMGTDSLYMSMLIDLGYDAHDVERKVITPEKIEDVIAARLPGHTPSTPADTTDGTTVETADETAVANTPTGPAAEAYDLAPHSTESTDDTTDHAVDDSGTAVSPGDGVDEVDLAA